MCVSVCELVLNNHRQQTKRYSCCRLQEPGKVFWPQQQRRRVDRPGDVCGARLGGAGRALCAVGVSKSCSPNEICSVARRKSQPKYRAAKAEPEPERNTKSPSGSFWLRKFIRFIFNCCFWLLRQLARVCPSGRHAVWQTN